MFHLRRQNSLSVGLYGVNYQSSVDRAQKAQEPQNCCEMGDEYCSKEREWNAARDAKEISREKARDCHSKTRGGGANSSKLENE